MVVDHCVNGFHYRGDTLTRTCMRLVAPTTLALILLALPLHSASPQFDKLKKLKQAKEAAERELQAKKDAEKAKADSIKAAKDNATGADAKKETAPAADASPGSRATSSTAAPAPPASPVVWEKYDFIPGNKILFFTDFSDDKTGNFARRLKYVSGPAEIVERDGVKMLRASGPMTFRVPVGRKLPERFTLELDVIAPFNGVLRESVQFEGGPEVDRGDQSTEVTWNPAGAFMKGAAGDMNKTGVQLPEATMNAVNGKLAHLRVLMDGAYFKMYVNERRLYNIPELLFKRDTTIRVSLGGAEEPGTEVYVASIRVAESETDVLYDALANKGRWSTQGILFATGKAELRPESRPVLKEIAETLKAHADLRILVEGHTDNVGASAANLALSEARAAAVKGALVSDFAIDASRITTKGFGDTKPVAPNATAEGKAQNRRVEVVKQ